jgi:hypothetical protein
VIARCRNRSRRRRRHAAAIGSGLSNLTSFLPHAVDRAVGLRDEKTAPFEPASHLARAPIEQGG